MRRGEKQRTCSGEYRRRGTGRDRRRRHDCAIHPKRNALRKPERRQSKSGHHRVIAWGKRPGGLTSVGDWNKKGSCNASTKRR